MHSAVNACQAPLIGRCGLWPNFLPLSERPEFMRRTRGREYPESDQQQPDRNGIPSESE
jgi:hypothetical protein